MLYISIVGDNENSIGVEAIVDPVFVKYQMKHNMFICCEQSEAQGIVSGNGENIYRLVDEEVPECEFYAHIITESEYDEWVAQHPIEDPEDTTPDAPEGEIVLTRAQLTQKVKELEEVNEFLSDCLLEMSEVIYA